MLATLTCPFESNKILLLVNIPIYMSGYAWTQLQRAIDELLITLYIYFYEKVVLRNLRAIISFYNV